MRVGTLKVGLMNTEKKVVLSVYLLSLELKELSQQWKELIIKSNFKTGNKTDISTDWGMSSLSSETTFYPELCFQV